LGFEVRAHFLQGVGIPAFGFGIIFISKNEGFFHFEELFGSDAYPHLHLDDFWTYP
jgi:hypothetical protein